MSVAHRAKVRKMWNRKMQRPTRFTESDSASHACRTWNGRLCCDCPRGLLSLGGVAIGAEELEIDDYSCASPYLPSFLVQAPPPILSHSISVRTRRFPLCACQPSNLHLRLNSVFSGCEASGAVTVLWRYCFAGPFLQFFFFRQSHSTLVRAFHALKALHFGVVHCFHQSLVTFVSCKNCIWSLAAFMRRGETRVSVPLFLDWSSNTQRPTILLS
jgi:hypothetical protein